MTGAEQSHPAPHRHVVDFWILVAAGSAAPIFWLGQLILGFLVSAQVCYGGPEPTEVASGAALRGAFYAFDAVALIAGLAGAAVSYICWRSVRNEKPGGENYALQAGEGRTRFLALWGMLSSGIFLGAIVFTIVVSIGVPLCTP
jgi:hypothetical protein